MVAYSTFNLDNGLTIIHHQDETTPFVVMNILYDVGARDEDPNKTGFAHLFEHLMFGGSVNIPTYDTPLQKAGGINNAYTNNDITNYYLRVPAQNIETAFWLESDRMLSLAFSPKSLEVQRKVVCEEFKENYINKPYGDVWQYLRKLVYKKHPYQWMTIGKELSHIENATLEDVKAFFAKFYTPSNAIMSVAGNVDLETVKRLSEKWFGPIPSHAKPERKLPQEPKQTEARTETVHKEVPSSIIYKAYPMSARRSDIYYTDDMVTDILGNGKSSRLYLRLVKEQELFANINCYQMGSLDPGLVVVNGQVKDGVDVQQASDAIDEVLHEMQTQTIEEDELQKIKNKIEAVKVFEDMDLFSRANELCWFYLLGDVDKINTEVNDYMTVTADNLQDRAQKLFQKENSNTLFYLAEG